MQRSPRDPTILVTYRELAPSPELRSHVRAYFSFTPGSPQWRSRRPVLREVHFTRDDSFCSPRFADGQTSLVLELGATCELGTGWTFGTPVHARVIGALRTVGAPAGNVRPEMMGVYFEPGATSALLHVPAIELTDDVVDLENLWGSNGTRLAEDVAALDEASRVDRLESALRERMRPALTQRSSIDVAGLARYVRSMPTTVAVNRLAEMSGVSRQHLTRVFREVIGVSPKRYCRVARFQAGLAYVGAASGLSWADVAAELGYTDQSHMIAEFRELSGLTPDALATERWFHPFILEARDAQAKKKGPAVDTAGPRFLS